jgi:hypothetical protein
VRGFSSYLASVSPRKEFIGAKAVNRSKSSGRFDGEDGDGDKRQTRDSHTDDRQIQDDLFSRSNALDHGSQADSTPERVDANRHSRISVYPSASSPGRSERLTDEEDDLDLLLSSVISDVQDQKPQQDPKPLHDSGNVRRPGQAHRSPRPKTVRQSGQRQKHAGIESGDVELLFSSEISSEQDRRILRNWASVWRQDIPDNSTQSQTGRQRGRAQRHAAIESGDHSRRRAKRKVLYYDENDELSETYDYARDFRAQHDFFMEWFKDDERQNFEELLAKAQRESGVKIKKKHNNKGKGREKPAGTAKEPSHKGKT